MNFFRQLKWIVQALVTISAQLNMIEKKVNILLQLAEDEGKLNKLARQLDTSTDSLAASVERNKPTTKGK